jgi:hypothetical protein
MALLVAAERAIRGLASRNFAELRGAQWIWAAGLTPDDGAVAFYLAREFELDFQPQRGRLWSLADEEYVVSLNGIVVGSNRFAEGATVDVYEVGSMLRRGRNRLLVELRSSRGVGGMLLGLEARGPEGVVRIVSDGAWRALRRHRRWLARPDTDLGADRLLAGGAIRKWAPVCPSWPSCGEGDRRSMPPAPCSTGRPRYGLTSSRCAAPRRPWTAPG